MPFRLSNAPSTIRRVMTQVLKPFIGKFLVVYFDDSLKKCSFFTNKVVFLGFIVSSEGVSANPQKFQAIVDWPEPKNIHDIWSFHGLASFYCRFIKGFSNIMSPITDCIKQGECFWTKAATKAFNEVKQKMTEAPAMHLSCVSLILPSLLKWNVMPQVLV